MCFVLFSERTATGFFYSVRWVVMKDCVYSVEGIESSAAIQVIVVL
jgi:hypothetical protein